MKRSPPTHPPATPAASGDRGRARRNLAKTRRMAQTLRARAASLTTTRQRGRHYAQLLTVSKQLQHGMRRLAHQVLAAQENERKNISDELHNEIVQTLFGINVQLLALKQEALNNSKALKAEIAKTQQVVRASTRSVRQFERELRSA